jgi:hypothetical protein
VPEVSPPLGEGELSSWFYLFGIGIVGLLSKEKKEKKRMHGNTIIHN